MKIRSLMMLPLAATLMLPAVAQQNASQDQNQATQSQPAQDQAQAQPDQTSARQPLTPEQHEGFWGKLNPFARKKYVQRQMSPIRNRVNELDELTAANAKNLKDVDSRAQEGIRLANNKATEADQHAIEAGNRAQQAHQTAQQASTRLQTVEQVITNFDQYQATNQTELRFRSGQTALSKNAKEALDELASSLQGQNNYIIEVQGFSPGNSAASIQASQKMADAVVRYMVLNHDIPVYRIFTLGMGNAKVAQPAAEQQEGSKPAKAYRGPRVQVSVLKNTSVDQLNQQAMATPQQNTFGTQSQQGGVAGAASQSQNQYQQTPSSGMQQQGVQSNTTQEKPSAQQPESNR
ncbi:MAG TPA: OmpA family protein [Terriglobales bacterium]|nr:OmpA family protein [Terriglobales bacterium]